MCCRLGHCRQSFNPRQRPWTHLMTSATLRDVEAVVRVMAETVLANEKYFGDLDAVVGDGDFGYSMARGFELVLRDWQALDRTGIAAFLRGVAVVITSRIGGTSGPIWGTAVLRAKGTPRWGGAPYGGAFVTKLGVGNTPFSVPGK